MVRSEGASTPATAEEGLLREALALDEAAVVVLVMGALGAGSVAGFEVTASGARTTSFFVDTSRIAVVRNGTDSGEADSRK